MSSFDFRWGQGVVDVLFDQGFVGDDCWVAGVCIQRHRNGDVYFQGSNYLGSEWVSWAYCYRHSNGRWYEVIEGNLGAMIDPETGKEYAPIYKADVNPVIGDIDNSDLDAEYDDDI